MILIFPKQDVVWIMIEMIKRAINKGVRFKYVLADSWFACKDIIRFIRSRHINCDYLGMIKVGENGRTKYHFERKDYTAPALIKFLSKRKLLSIVKKVVANETIGKLFEPASMEALGPSIVKRIWGVLQEVVIAIANLFGLTDEDFYDAMINQSKDMNHRCDIYNLKLAS